MSPTLSFIIKETRHITRDRRTMLILFGMPVVMMLLFSFAIRTDLRNVNLAVVTSSMGNRTQQIIDRLNASEYFTVTHCVDTPEEAHGLIVARKADMAVAFTSGFANHRYDATAGIQLITDYTDSNTGEMQNVYAQQIISVALASPATVKTVPPVNSRLLYNPQMKSAYNFVPGIMGMLLILICAIVREKERGTMEVLLASPVRPIVIIIAKAIPYMLLSIGILISILVISKYVLAVPLTGSLWALFGLSLLYILLALALGLLISIIADTQLAALLLSGMVLLLPNLMLSGMIYPIESMPAILQYLSAIVPARWYISAVRKLMIMGVGFEFIRQELFVLLSMAAVIMTVALAKFKIRLQ